METKKALNSLFEKKSFSRWILILGIAGMALILISSFWPEQKSTEEVPQTSASDVESYTTQLESEITNLVSQIEGVGSCSVMITLENGVEKVYANSEKNSNNNTNDYNVEGDQKTTAQSDSEQDVVVVDGSDGKEALVVTQKEPTVKGVVVVCDGADNPTVVQRVTDAVTTALNIKSNRVSVVKAAANNLN